MGGFVDVIDCHEGEMNEAWKEWDYGLLGEVDKLFMEFPIALSFISENLRYKPTENKASYSGMTVWAGQRGWLFF